MVNCACAFSQSESEKYFEWIRNIFISFFFAKGLGKGEAPPPPPPASTPRTPSAEETAESVSVNVGLNISEVSHFFWQSISWNFFKTYLAKMAIIWLKTKPMFLPSDKRKWSKSSTPSSICKTLQIKPKGQIQ